MNDTHANPSTGGTAAVTAVDVSYTYPGADAPALTDVNVTVHPGEYVALLGPNGAGKTTLINTITGLRVPDRGTVRVAGGDPTRAKTRLGLGVVLQNTAFPPHLNVEELVVGAAIRCGMPRSAAQSVIEEVGLTDLRHRRSGKLSGGQQRRLQLARALVADPALLVLDEPTEGLDADARQDFWRNLSARRDAGMAILLTTHLIAEAGAVADRVTVIANGRVVADEAPDRLAHRLPDRTVSVRTTLSPDQIRSTDGVIDVQRTESGLIHILTRDPEAVVRLVLNRDADAHDLRVEGASLEQAVMAVSDVGQDSQPIPNRVAGPESKTINDARTTTLEAIR